MLKRILFIGIIPALLAAPAMAATCPVECLPKTPTCEERIARAKRAGCEMPATVKIVDHEVLVPGPERIVIKEVPGPVQIVEKIVEVPVVSDVETTPKGHWLAGAGPVWLNNWGATAVVGYQFKTGWQLQGGPIWVPQHGSSGSVTNCQSSGYPETYGHNRGGNGCGCVTLPYSVPSPQPWGGQLLAIYAF